MKYGRKERRHYEVKSIKQDLTTAKGLTIMLPEDTTPPTIGRIKITNLPCSSHVLTGATAAYR